MNALFDRFHNFILPIVRGKDAVCGCTCGRHQVYHVVPYNEAQSVGATRGDWSLGDVVSRQEMNVLVGLLLGFCISLFLQWLQINGEGFWSWMPKVSNNNKKVVHPRDMEDSTGNMLPINQDVHQNVNDT